MSEPITIASNGNGPDVDVYDRVVVLLDDKEEPGTCLGFRLDQPSHKYKIKVRLDKGLLSVFSDGYDLFPLEQVRRKPDARDRKIADLQAALAEINQRLSQSTQPVVDALNRILKSDDLIEIEKQSIVHAWKWGIYSCGVHAQIVLGTEYQKRPTIVCLCGSTRFRDAFHQANLVETLAGRIVLTIGCDMRSDAEIFADKSEEELAEIKRELDDLHQRKIDLADHVLVLNIGGYIGASTAQEIAYAKSRGKFIRYWERQTDPNVSVEPIPGSE